MNSTKAPSERHLEDWLVANWDTSKQKIPFAHSPLLGRQIPLPSGIPDLICASVGIQIVELKKDRITLDSLAQILRYIRDAVGIRLFALAEIRHRNPPELNALLDPMIMGVLVGCGVDSTETLIAAAACDVEVYAYSFNGDSYSFEKLTPPIQTRESYVSHSFKALGKAFVDAYMILYDLLQDFPDEMKYLCAPIDALSDEFADNPDE